MCGIVGFNVFQNSVQTNYSLQKMLDRISHRGPDSEGQYIGEHIAFGARRLSIVDIENGSQPFTNESEEILAVFNGEIYNHKSIKDFLKKKGHIFNSECDGEILTHLYEEFNISFLSRLDGMFSFALWDKKQQRLILACDSIGIKPLYYMNIFNNTGIAFASEVKALKVLSSESFCFDPVSIAEYLRFKAIPPPYTIYKNLKKLLPSEAVVWHQGNITTHRYRMDRDLFKSYNQNGLEINLINQIRSTMSGDVKIGCILSGGLDSSFVTKIASENISYPLSVFSVGYPGMMLDDESKYARKLTETLESNFYHILVNPCEIPFLLEKIVWHLDEPLQNPVCIPFFCLMKEIKNYLKVVLTGDGADELFGGYSRYSHWDSRLPQSAQKYKNDLFLFSIEELKSTLHKDRLNEMLIFREADDSLGKVNNLKSAMEWELNYRQPSYHLARIDKLSMAWGVEARVPYLRPKIVNTAQSLDTTQLRRNGIEKYALRNAVKSHLPDWIMKRKKKTFKFPIGEWITHELKDWVNDELLNAICQGCCHIFWLPVLLIPVLFSFRGSTLVMPLSRVEMNAAAPLTGA